MVLCNKGNSNLLIHSRWGMSTLFVDFTDMLPENLTAATEKINHVNLMPAYGLNVHSMLKHKTLVVTEEALNHLEARLLRAIYRIDRAEVAANSMKVPLKAKFVYK